MYQGYVWGDCLDFISVMAIGIALAMDAVAVSVSCGSLSKSSTLKYVVFTAFTFGFFQFFMPVLGWSIGKVGKNFVEDFDHWIAFGILCFLGIKMIYESKKNNDCELLRENEQNKLKTLIVMAFATSIDALTTGIVLPTTVKADTPLFMFLAVLTIGIITFILSLIGFFVGKSFRTISPKAAEIFGGIVLIVIGIKTLITG